MLDRNEELVNLPYHYRVGEGDLIDGMVGVRKEVQLDSAYLMNMVVKQITDDLKQQGKIVKRADQFFCRCKKLLGVRYFCHWIIRSFHTESL